ncbi:MAG: hypothetical protein ACLQIB_51645 [Isosphaeraceae bacterium]
MTTASPLPVGSRPRRAKGRLRALLAVNALALCLYVFVRLDRPVAESFGPAATDVYDLFNPSEGIGAPLSATARRFVNDVKAQGGEPNVAVLKPGFLGIFGRSESFEEVDALVKSKPGLKIIRQ